jgi:hypothetical protein
VEPVALGDRPFRVRLVGEELALVELRRAAERPAGAGAVAVRGGGDAEAGVALEVVGVDPDAVEVEPVAAVLARHERGGLPRGATRLEAAAEVVHGEAHVLERAAVGARPEGGDQLVGVRHPPAVGEQQLEQLARALAQPGAVERALGRGQVRAAEHADVQLRACGPAGVGAAAAVAGPAGAQVQQRAADGQRRGRDPHAAQAVAGVHVDADLGQRPRLGERPLGDASARERPVRAPASEQRAAGLAGQVVPSEDQRGLGVAGAHDAALDDEEAVREALVDEAREVGEGEVGHGDARQRCRRPG